MSATKVDMLRDWRELYVPRRTPVLVHIPEFNFLMIDGHGDPSSSTHPAIEALYRASFRLKFALKRGPLALDYKVMPLEGLWWVPDMTTFSVEHKEDWDWTLMIRQPDEVDEEMLGQVQLSLPLRLERWKEGKVAQLMHIGPYAAEGPSVQELHAFIEDQGLERVGKHHEIYLGDPRRAAPKKLRTVLRQPVRSR
jgi:hypothetical protein